MTTRRHLCDCRMCPCNVPFDGPGRDCPECKGGNHMDWRSLERLDTVKGVAG